MHWKISHKREEKEIPNSVTDFKPIDLNIFKSKRASDLFINRSQKRAKVKNY